jgi:drug/metabolite transporter (DMT)-like permease
MTVGKGSTIRQELMNLNWSSFVLGIAIVGLEAGFLFAYRAGWKVSIAQLVASSILAIALIFIGLFLFKENITLRHIIGIIVCLAGLAIINLK